MGNKAWQCVVIEMTVQWEDEHESLNEGNFIQLVGFRAKTDEVLTDHLSNCPRSARYTYKTILNELLQVADT